MKLAEKYLNLFEKLSKKDLDVIADILHNDENSTDKEVVEFIVSETGLEASKVEKLVKAERSNFLGPKYMNNSTADDHKIIKKYLG